MVYEELDDAIGASISPDEDEDDDDDDDEDEISTIVGEDGFEKGAQRGRLREKRVVAVI
jgi:hypothetical protein